MQMPCVHLNNNNLLIYYLVKIERTVPTALKMEGVKESLSSAQHFGRNNTEFASVWVVTSKSLRK